MNCLLVLMTVLLVEIVSVSLLDEDAAKKVEDFSPELKRVKRAQAKSSFTTEEKITIINKHNEHRRTPGASNMEIMYWDTTLETLAQNWANTCKFKHNPDRKTLQSVYSTVGENIYYTTGTVAGHPEGFINDWYNEVTDYTYDTLKCTKDKYCTHYTQIVWHNSDVLGCGVKFCETAEVFSKEKNNVNIVVCDYGPAGNYNGQKPYLEGTNCSSCPSEKSTCLDGLCGVANCGGKTCQNGGKMVTEICFCDCRNTGYKGDTCETAPASETTTPSNNVTKNESGRVLANTYQLMTATALYVLNNF